MGVYEKAKKLHTLFKADHVASNAEQAAYGTLIGITIAADVIHAASADGSDESRTKVIADVDRVVAEFLTPIDLPWVHNALEPFADMGIASGIRTFVEQVFSWSAERRERLAEILKAA